MPVSLLQPCPLRMSLEGDLSQLHILCFGISSGQDQIEERAMAFVKWVRIEGQLAPVGGQTPLPYLPVVLGNHIKQVFSRHFALLVRYTQQHFEVFNGPCVFSANRVAASPADSAFLIRLVDRQSACEVHYRIVDAVFDFGDLAQVKMRVVAIKVAIARILVDDPFEGSSGRHPIGLSKSLASVFEPIRDCLWVLLARHFSKTPC